MNIFFAFKVHTQIINSPGTYMFQDIYSVMISGSAPLINRHNI